MRLVVTEFMTLDGILDEPQEWSFAYWSDEATAFKLAERKAAAALLMGRVTYDAFASAWPARTGELADMMNSLPKYIVSKTLRKADWSNSHVITGDIAKEIAALKASGDGDLLVDGSVTLARTLANAGLVDRYTLIVFPLTLGSGKRLFDGVKTKLALVASKSLGSGVLALTYEPTPR